MSVWKQQSVRLPLFLRSRYRKLLLERDEELKMCKMENEKLREEQKHFIRDTTTHSPLKELAGGQFFQNGSVFENVDIAWGGRVGGRVP